MEPRQKVLINRKKLHSMIPLSERTIFNMEQRGEFPRRIALTRRNVAWDLAEVEAWIEARKASCQQAVRALRTDAARLIHQRLCAWIDPGKSGRADIDTLCGYVWPDAAVNANTVKTRRQTVRRALAELDALGWRVESYTKDKWEISRPKLTEPRLGR